jgi:superfamily I DNA/RNA helicase
VLVAGEPGGRASAPTAPRLVRLASRVELVQRIVTRYQNRGESVGVVVWSKVDARALYAALRGALPPEDRVDVYTSDAEKGTEVGIRLLDSGITVLTGESVIGLEFDVVFLLDLRRSLPCVTQADSRRMYMLCARARAALLLVDLPPYLDPDQVAALPGPPILDR